MTSEGAHIGVLLRSMLEICERSMRKADCGTVAASRQATCAARNRCHGHAGSVHRLVARLPCRVCMHPREDAVGQADARGPGGDEGAHVSQKHDEGDLLGAAALPWASRHQVARCCFGVVKADDIANVHRHLRSLDR